MEEYVQIGVTAKRNADGTFQPSVPLYVKTNEVHKASGLTEGEEKAVEDVIPLLAGFFKQYARETGLIGRKKSHPAKPAAEGGRGEGAGRNRQAGNAD